MGDADFSMVESTVDGKKHALVYAGDQVYTGEVKDSEEVDTYIFIRNKLTNKVKVVPVQEALMYNHVYKKLERQKRTGPTMSREHANKKLLKEFEGARHPASWTTANR